MEDLAERTRIIVVLTELDDDYSATVDADIEVQALDGDDKVAEDILVRLLGGGDDDKLTLSAPGELIVSLTAELYGEDGEDVLHGSYITKALRGDGDDIIYSDGDGGAGDDKISGEFGNGGDGNDELTGFAGVGGEGADLLETRRLPPAMAARTSSFPSPI